MYKYSDLLRGLRLWADMRHDPWGATMSAWFDIADELTRRGTGTPPAWGYSPGAAGPPPADECGPMWDIVDRVAVPDATLIAWGDRLCDLADGLREAGRDY